MKRVRVRCPKCGAETGVLASWISCSHRCPSNRNRNTYWVRVEEGTDDGI